MSTKIAKIPPAGEQLSATSPGVITEQATERLHGHREQLTGQFSGRIQTRA